MTDHDDADTTNESEPIHPHRHLVAGMLSTYDLNYRYLTDARFHHQIDHLARVLVPAMVAALEEESRVAGVDSQVVAAFGPNPKSLDVLRDAAVDQRGPANQPASGHQPGDASEDWYEAHVCICGDLIEWDEECSEYVHAERVGRR